MRRTFACVLVLGSLAAAPARAMQVQLSRPELCARSGRVVIGEVTSAAAEWAEGRGGKIVTRADVLVSRTLVGRAGDVEVLLPGGELGGLRYVVEDAATLVPDATYLLLLVEGAGGWQVQGGGQGAIMLSDAQGRVVATEAAAVASLGGCGAGR